MEYYKYLIVLSLGVKCVFSFWPPAYKVDLNDKKVFVIVSDDTEYDDENENEMIQAADLAQFESLKDDEKYKPLHSHVELYNKRAARTATEFAEAFPLFQPNLEEVHNLVEEAKPFVAGFKRELDEYDFDDLEERIFEAIRRKRNVSNHSILNKVMKLKVERVTQSGDDENAIEESIERTALSTTFSYSQTRESNSRKIRQLENTQDQTPQEIGENHESTTELQKGGTERRKDDSTEETSDEEDYDYDLFKAEYYQQIEYSKKDNKTFNYTENGEPEKTAEDAVRKIVDFKMPRNCTREELTEFGAKALECLAYDYKHAKNKKSVSKILFRTWVVVRVWICVYLCIALPCWCQKGWCCCCFRCAFCDPMDSIVTAKKYYAENPPGVLVEHSDLIRKESKTTEFEPTLFELEAYEKFEAAIRNL